ncbi:gamma-glutamyltransferase [Thiosocius teredinicola]|uniref:gamma-glutamyltransferase n=1 Tax=Thiosocius teredinicola TaxID=1973002 RepID=UPI0009912C3F
MPDYAHRLWSRKAPLWSLFALWLTCSAGAVASTPSAEAIASAHPLATEAGLLVLDAGGNAFDAAVAVSAALAVVEPYGSGIGGGGFWLLHRERDGYQVMIDGRERAPLAATADMYLDSDGEVIPRKSIDGALAAGIPGVPAALDHLANYYGRLPLAVSLAPAIGLAEEGFPVDSAYRRMAGVRLEALRASDQAAVQYLVEGDVPPEGYRLKQPQLAATLRAIAEGGAAAFYTGDIAERLVAGVREAGGIWSLRDLRDYHTVERRPIVTEYQGYRVVSASLPSSGGILLAEMLQMLNTQRLQQALPSQRAHVLVEVMRRAYADRARYLGDADHVAVPVAFLTNPAYQQRRAQQIDLDAATPSVEVWSPGGEGHDTTHFSILDRQGNRVAATLSINYPFGSGTVVGDTGVLLNDEMDDFVAKPGVPNVYGLVGTAANAIAPGKRMLSSMSPTFIEGEDMVAIVGTPGGSRIISMVLLAILDAVDERPVEDWVSRGRIHHQYLPDKIQVEPGSLSDAEIATLERKGHTIDRLQRGYGNMQAVKWDMQDNTVTAASDPRGIGHSVVRSVAGQTTAD